MPSGIPVCLRSTWEPLLSLSVDCVKKSKLTASLSRTFSHTNKYALSSPQQTRVHARSPIRARRLLPPHLFLSSKWLNRVLKCTLELREKSSRLQKFVRVFNSTPIWMHRRGHFRASGFWLKMSRALLCAFGAGSGHDVDRVKWTSGGENTTTCFTSRNNHLLL